MPRFARDACGRLMENNGMGWIPARSLGAAITFVPPAAFGFRVPTPYTEVVEVPQPVYLASAGSGGWTSDHDESGFACDAGTKKNPMAGVISCTKDPVVIGPDGWPKAASYTCSCGKLKPGSADTNPGFVL